MAFSNSKWSLNFHILAQSPKKEHHGKKNGTRRPNPIFLKINNLIVDKNVKKSKKHPMTTQIFT